MGVAKVGVAAAEVDAVGEGLEETNTSIAGPARSGHLSIEKGSEKCLHSFGCYCWGSYEIMELP